MNGKEVGMRILKLAAVGLALAAPLRLAAQNECNSVATQARGACNRAVDAYKTFQPLGGIVISGGNPELGAGRTLGGFGHLFASLRVNAVKAVVPNPDTTQVSIAGTVPAPVAEAGVGLYRGLPGGLLALDALASATLLPTNLDKLSVDSSASRIGSMALGLGYGVRVGILHGGFPIPAVSLSVMRRTLPRVRLGSLSAGDDFEFDTDLRATNVRLIAGMRLVMIDAAVGVGFDRYASTGHLRFYNNPPLKTTVQEITVPVKNSRQVLFVNAGLSLVALRIVGEIGYQTGKDQRLSASYSDFDPKVGHVFGGFGLRFSF
jgi:hypothetical protein